MFPMSDPACAVIIPHYNDMPRLLRCLEALMPQVSDDVEVIVADNNSPVPLDEVTAAYPDIRIVVQTEKGAGLARNLGVSETNAPVILFVDADCVPDENWLAHGRAIVTENTLIGGPVPVFHETEPPMTGAEAFEQVFAFKMKAYLERDAFLGSGNLVFYRDVFEKVGGFKAAVAEDKEWSRRAASLGVTLAFDDDFIAGHPSRQDWTALRRKWKRLEEEDFELQGRSTATRLKRVKKALLMPFSIPAHMPQILRTSSLNGGEKVRALLTLARIRFARTGWILRQAMTGKP